jgi:hypothetical protein
MRYAMVPARNCKALDTPATVKSGAHAMHMITPELDTYTRAEAAQRLGLSTATLKRYAATGRGPAFARTGDKRGRVIYTAADLAAWLESRKQVPRASAAR